jgi:hypothetical protein
VPFPDYVIRRTFPQSRVIGKFGEVSHNPVFRDAPSNGRGQRLELPKNSTTNTTIANATPTIMTPLRIVCESDFASEQ